MTSRLGKAGRAVRGRGARCRSKPGNQFNEAGGRTGQKKGNRTRTAQEEGTGQAGQGQTGTQTGAQAGREQSR